MPTVPHCPHLPPCPGCPRFGALDAAPPAIAQLSDFCVKHGAQWEVRVGARHGFRQRARLAVRGRRGAPKIGIFEQGSHRVVDIPGCVIHHPLINVVARALKATMREQGATCYSDTAHAGLVRALQVVIERGTQTAQVVIVCNGDTPEHARPLLDAFAARLGSVLHSLWWNGNPERTNVILGPHFWQHSGRELVEEQLGGARVFFPPAAFGQNNLDLFESMLEQIRSLVPPGRDVVELYAGCGAIGLGLVQRSRSVLFNEIGSASLAGLARGIEALGPVHGARVRVVAGSAEAAATAIGPGSVVIVDPPRKGLEAPLLASLAASTPDQLVYVSCGLTSFLRDAAELIGAGLRLQSATAYDLFPYTDHVETLAAFRRCDPGEAA